jgi:hypothetical protein
VSGGNPLGVVSNSIGIVAILRKGPDTYGGIKLQLIHFQFNTLMYSQLHPFAFKIGTKRAKQIISIFKILAYNSSFLNRPDLNSNPNEEPGLIKSP